MNLITKIAHHTANSYGTLSEAEAYFDKYGRLGDDATWDTLSINQKEYALILAAEILNTFSYRGSKVIKNQRLAFPRFTNDQLKQGYSTLDTYFDVEYTSIVSNKDLSIDSENKFIDLDTPQDVFLKYINNSLFLNQVIKVQRSGDTEYLTIKDMDNDEGNWIQVWEDIEEYTDLTTSISSLNIFGFPEQIKFAQFELAYQVVDTKIFQGTVGDASDFPVSSFNISGAITVRYRKELFTANKFENSNQIDIVYHLIGNWMSSIHGGLV
jgi:hypothetical protein